MPRQERPLDRENGPLPAFACELRELKSSAGLTYRQMAELRHYSHAVFVKATQGRVLPTWKVTQEFVTACGANSDQVTWWHEYWQKTKNVISAANPLPTPAVTGNVSDIRTAKLLLYVPDGTRLHTAADLADALMKVKASAGNPAFRTMARRVGVPPSTLADQCNAKRLRFYWENVSRFLDACDVPSEQRVIWHCVFQQVIGHAADRQSALLPNSPGSSTDLTGPQRSLNAKVSVRHHSWRLAVVATIAFILIMAGVYILSIEGSLVGNR